ncbi:MAG: DUF3592 domain-containing protein [Nibricoccus sp.]
MALSFKLNTDNKGTGSRIVSTIFFGMFLLAGLAAEIFVVGLVAKSLSTQGWTQAEAVIITAEVKPPRGSDDSPVLHLGYTYKFRGDTRVGKRIKVGSEAWESSDAYRLAERYHPGAVVPCWVNPHQPADSILVRESRWILLVPLFPLIFASIGGIGIWSTWRKKKSPAGGDQPISARSAGKAQQKIWLLFFLFGIFLLVGLGGTYGLLVRPLLRISAAKNWPEAPCEVVSSRVQSHSSDDGTTYSVDIVYRYTFNNHSFTSNRYNFMTGSSSGYEGKASIVRKFPPGTQTVCFVNPADPQDSVLSRAISPAIWFGLIPMIFALVGGGGLVFALRSRKNSTSTFWASPSGSTGSSATAGVTIATTAGPKTLAPALTRRAKLIGLTIFAVFWNGIVGVFVYNIFDSRSSGFSWFGALFLVPFVAVGLGVIGGVFYYLMALFNPRPTITVSTDVAHPGDHVELTWELSGNTQKLRRLQISFVGQEEATYRRGTSTSTDKEVFHRSLLADTADPAAFPSGKIRFQLPNGLMHSFRSANNKVVWMLNVYGDIPRWPDIKDEYPFTVAPLPLKK